MFMNCSGRLMRLVGWLVSILDAVHVVQSRRGRPPQSVGIHLRQAPPI